MAAPAGTKRKSVYEVKMIDTTADIYYKDKSKGTYKGVELIYLKEYQGQVTPQTKAFASKSLDHVANSAFKAGLLSLSKGDKFTVTEVMSDAGFWDWKEIVKGVDVQPSDTPQRTSGSNGGGNSNFGADKTLEIAGGRALNNAVVLLGAGATLEEVKAFAHDFYKMEQQFMAELKAGGKVEEAAPAPKPVAQKKAVQEEPAGFDDSDIPF